MLTVGGLIEILKSLPADAAVILVHDNFASGSDFDQHGTIVFSLSEKKVYLSSDSHEAAERDIEDGLAPDDGTIIYSAY